jgi:hypothetical protein
MPQRWDPEVTSRKPRRNYTDLLLPDDDTGRRRSYEVPLLWIGVAAFVGLPMLRDATSDRMLRNRYGNDSYSCECDYGRDRCSYRDGQWVGPWYARDAQDRQPDDPGAGSCRSGGGHGGYAYSGQRGTDPYRSPTSVERGYRGGFGGTGRVRAAGS